MNRDNNKFDFGELLTTQEEGYTFSRAVGTTYSLDLKALIAVPVSLRFSGALDADSLKDPFQLFLSLKDTAKKIDIFCQLGGISANTKSHRLYRFLEDSIHEVFVPGNLVFHPKVWVVRFDHDTLTALYKLIVLTRNMTFDSCWDMAVELEGTVNPSRLKVDQQTNKPLVDFINHLYNLSSSEAPSDFIADLSAVTFRPVGIDEYDSVNLFPMGIPGYGGIKAFVKPEHADEIIAVSPFLSEQILSNLKDSTDHLTVISRVDAFQKLNSEHLKNVKCYRINDQIVDGDTRLESENDTSTPKDANEIMSNPELPDYKIPNDLHAKAFLFKYGMSYELYIGSANATYNAQHGNVEFMVLLKGTRKNSAQVFLESYFSESDQFIIPYEPDPGYVIPETDKIELLVDQGWKDLLANLKSIKGEASKSTNELFEIQIDVSGFSEIQKGLQVYIRPFHLQADLRKELKPGRDKILFADVDPADLSGFFVITVLSIENPEIRREGVVKLPLENMPANREELVVRSLFSSKKEFFRLLKLLLSEDMIDALLGYGEEENENASISSAGWTGYMDLESPLFEKLMKAASRDRKKLLDVNSVISIFEKADAQGQSSSDQEVSDFLKLWKTFSALLETTPEHV